jgi:pimeloyl-ACP methyl ester carboxylesterase
MAATPIPVLFIPALLSDEAMYREVIERLGDRIDPRVMVLSEPTMQANVATVLAGAPPRFVAVGTSYGGSVALEVALAAPGRVMALWLMGCDPAAPGASVQGLARGLEDTPGAVIDMLAGLAVPKKAAKAAEAFRAMAGRVGGRAGAAQARALASRAEVTSRLGALRMPALVVWGEADRIAPAPVGRALADALPPARFHALPACGHLPTLERPAECAELALGLLEEVAGHGHRQH